MASTHNARDVTLVKDETSKPNPTAYARLLPTLQTYAGMVLGGGQPQKRTPYTPELSEQTFKDVADRVTGLRTRCRDLTAESIKNPSLDRNFEACSLPVTKQELIDYVRHGKRVDTEQAVAMAIAFLAPTASDCKKTVAATDDFESGDIPAIDELINDFGTVEMLTKTCMWREAQDFQILEDPRVASTIAKKNKILRLLGEGEEPGKLPSPTFTALLQTLRRKRSKLENTQHLTLPAELLEHAVDQNEQWTSEHSYSRGPQEPVVTANVRVISKKRFKQIHRIVHRMGKPTDVTSVYVLDVENFTKQSGGLSARRLAALEASNDPYAIAYSFIAAERRFQLKVVSDHRWSRFLIPGEGKLLLQNRPDVLTSFEDILVRHASDLRALTAITCPKGVRDHFSTQQETKDRARGVCEFMERYVNDFGNGKMENLVFSRERSGGSGRGPVDVYNALCDELRSCRARATAVGFDLDIGPVYKFLAKDIMAWNNAWADDAFAGGKVPGWLEYLARVRAEEIGLGD